LSLVGVVTAVTSAITGAVVSVVEVVVLSEVVVLLSEPELELLDVSSLLAQEMMVKLEIIIRQMYKYFFIIA
jgi:hypothetical protein